MSVLVKATAAQKPRTTDSMKVSLVYVGILVVMAVAQLFTFEDFIIYIRALNLPLSSQAVAVVAPLIVVSEVFALPFLLRMWLSPAFRYLSMFLSWLAAALWIVLSLWIVNTHPPVTTVGFLGTVVDLMPGWWAVFISLALGVLAAWSTWGLWPGKRNDK